MSVELRGLRFAIEPTPEGAGALAVRHNAREPISSPEIAGLPTDQRAAACYALDQIAGRDVAIEARLARGMPETDRIEVRAVARPRSQEPLPWWVLFAPTAPWLLPQALAYWTAVCAYVEYASAFTPSAASPAGEVRAREVLFQGSEAVVTFRVDVSGLPPRGVGAHPVRWRWQFRRSAGDGWIDFASTRHTMYVVIGTPSLPWVQSPNVPANTQLPWTDVLDVACRWAAGATTREQAAERITRAVYALGETGVVEYDCAGPGVFGLGTPHYTLIPGFFDCTRFLERIHGGFGNSRFVNCSDCAAAVATFANVLGCDLSQSRMFGPVPFPLNPTRSIGSQSWLSACALGAYAMHEVAWTGACGENDDVYDACLAVDGDADPTRPPHTPRLPVGMRFGASGQGSYRDRLVAPAGRQILSAAAAEPSAPGAHLRWRMAQQPLDAMDVVKRRFRFDAWQGRTSPGAPRFVWNLGFRGDELPGFGSERIERMDLAALVEREAPPAHRALAERMSRPAPAAHVQAIWRHAVRPDVRVAVDVFETASVADAWELVAWLLGEFESPLVEPKESVGEIEFGGRDEGVRLFSRANLVYLLRNIGRRPAPVLQAAIALDADVTSHPGAMPGRAAPLEAAAEEDDEPVEVPVAEAATAREEPLSCRKFFAPAGEIRMTGGQIVYRGPRAGLRGLNVAEVSCGARRRYQ